MLLNGSRHTYKLTLSVCEDKKNNNNLVLNLPCTVEIKEVGGVPFACFPLVLKS